MTCVSGWRNSILQTKRLRSQLPILRLFKGYRESLAESARFINILFFKWLGRLGQARPQGFYSEYGE